MPTLEDAILLATQAHAGQIDKAGKPYIQHVLRVMSYLSAEDEQITGVLHDVIENSAHSLDELRQLGYPDSVLEALDCLTRRPTERYEVYIQRVKPNDLARRVKLADLRDNMNMSRLATPTARDWKRYTKYKDALRQLEG